MALFTRMLEAQPVHSIRRDVEALKIAFYRIRRAEVEAAPVSYTHLDVYKRQAPVELVDDVGVVCDLFRRVTQGQIQQRPLLVVAVSYTHLDVYKRQGLYERADHCARHSGRGAHADRRRRAGNSCGGEDRRGAA